ncbi:hypothetical protein Hdeb2414_s0154g00815761 [Helianthus debilis subsp. tardiflorus]
MLWLSEGIHVAVHFYLSKHSVSTHAPMSITFSPGIKTCMFLVRFGAF